MPTYDYACKTCENRVSIMLSIKENPKAPVCIECKAEMPREYGVQAVTFKGTGWASKEK